MQIARIVNKTRVEGPFLRAAIWLQGCKILCDGCCNPEFHPMDAGSNFSVDDLKKNIFAIPEIEGISLLGGEPLEQSFELEEFLLGLRKETDLGVILFTGYTSGQICSNSNFERVARLCDLIISGPFIKDQAPDRRMWIGSKNQEVIKITDRYNDVCENWPMGKLDIEICISDGEISFNGTPLEEFTELNDIFSKFGGKN
jgi:anaerobic ribonucleoside-triphosphate reductase activating protein